MGNQDNLGNLSEPVFKDMSAMGAGVHPKPRHIIHVASDIKLIELDGDGTTQKEEKARSQIWTCHQNSEPGLCTKTQHDHR